MSQRASIYQPAWQLSDLLKDWVTVNSTDDVLVTGVSQYSGDTTSGDLFLATNGPRVHGLEFCGDAISKGAAAIAWEPVNDKSHSPDYSVPAIEFQNLSDYVGEIALRCYGDLNTKLKTIAITGTDGKSSVAHMTAQALNLLNDTCGLIGTIGYGRLENLDEATHTTPPVTRLAKEFAKLADSGCKYVAMEASSHGIAQNRLQNLNIETAVLTNITRDHLDYHQNVEDYIKSKSKLFFACNPNNVVLNYDDEIGCKWSDDLSDVTNIITYSLENQLATIHTSQINYFHTGTSLRIHIGDEYFDLQLSLLGEFNILNALAVSAILSSLDKSNHEIAKVLPLITPVPGRMQVLHSETRSDVIVDYAHTPAALLAAINATRQHYNGKLICVFGCGGERDSGKRPKMGAVATGHADISIITSDNPRHEDPEKIIEEIVQGCLEGACYEICVERKAAIEYALQMAAPADVVLVAGKGHEKYQQIGDDRIKFDDVQIVTDFLSR